MPRPYTISSIKPLKGLRTNTARASLEQGEFTVLDNFNPHRGGFLERRKGIYRAASTHPSPAGNPLRLLGMTRVGTPTSESIWATNSVLSTGALYRGSLATWPPTWTTVASVSGMFEWGFEWGLIGTPYEFHMCRRDGVTTRVTSAGINATTAGPLGTFCIPYKNRMWVLNSVSASGEENRIYFSGVNNFSLWTSPSGGSIDVRLGDGEFLVTCVAYNDTLYLFKNRSIWAINASSEDQTTYAPLLVNPTLGCSGRGSVQLIDGFIYFFSGEGVYRTDGTTFEEISEPIRDKFKDLGYAARVDVLKIDSCYYDNKYILSFNNSNVLYVYDTVSEAWCTWTLATSIIPNGFSIQPDYSPLAITIIPEFFMGSMGGHGYLYTSGKDWYRDDTVDAAGGGDANNIVATASMGDLTMDTSGEYKRNFYHALDVKGVNQGTLAVTSTHQVTTPTYTKILADAVRRYVRFPGTGKYRFKGLNLTAGTVAGQVPGAMQIYSIDSADQLREKANRLVGNAS